jgi:hypothetical protein
MVLGAFFMHVVGLDEIVRFLSSKPDCHSSGALEAFTAELTNRTWLDPVSMSRDYPLISFKKLPQVTFTLAPCGVVVHCLIDFRTATVLIDGCKPNACRCEIHGTALTERAV